MLFIFSALRTTTGNSALLFSVPTELTFLSPFLVENVILKYDKYLVSTRLWSMPIDGHDQFVMD